MCLIALGLIGLCCVLLPLLIAFELWRHATLILIMVAIVLAIRYQYRPNKGRGPDNCQ